MIVLTFKNIKGAFTDFLAPYPPPIVMLRTIIVQIKKVRPKVNMSKWSIPAGNYMFKVNNRNFRTRCDIC